MKVQITETTLGQVGNAEIGVGSPFVATFRLFVGMACTACTNRFAFTDGRVRRQFVDEPPVFTPGRSGD